MSGPIAVLDAGAVELAAEDTDARSRIRGLSQRGWTFVIPTVVLAECLTGTPRDARTNRVIGRFGTVAPTEAVARTAAALRFATPRTPRRPLPSGIDALVAAHALHLDAEVVLTTDLTDLRRLLANRPEIGVERA